VRKSVSLEGKKKADLKTTTSTKGMKTEDRLEELDSASILNAQAQNSFRTQSSLSLLKEKVLDTLA